MVYGLGSSYVECRCYVMYVCIRIETLPFSQKLFGCGVF
jgi:hypothetical protein